MDNRQRFALVILSIGCGVPIFVIAGKFVNSYKQLFILSDNTSNEIVKKQTTSDIVGEVSSADNIPTTNKVVQCDCAQRTIMAAQKAIKSVVHVKATQKSKIIQRSNPMEDLLEEFFRFGFGGGEKMDRGKRQYKYRTQPSVAMGSGVIIQKDGFIITNNHVIDNADEIEVILSNNMEYIAKLIGTDPDNDVALLKIDAQELPILPFGNSDKTEIGEPILSVGNPFSVKELSSTVTSGIISGKTRELRDADHILPSLLQTDAAVNSGCSGGALVNLYGELIGMNVAIASTGSGTFVGYSYAIPSNIILRVVNDLKRYGYVQKVVLGIAIEDVSEEIAKKRSPVSHNGCYISKVDKDSQASKAGIKNGDIIIAINDTEVLNSSMCREALIRCEPGQTIKIKIERDGKIKDFTIVTQASSTLRIEKNNDSVTIAGATFKNLDEKTMKYLKEYDITNGVQLIDIKEEPWKGTFKKGYIVQTINDVPINTIDDVINMLMGKKGVFTFDGFYLHKPKEKKCYAVRLGEE